MEISTPLLVMGSSPLMKADCESFLEIYKRQVDYLAVGMDVMDRIAQNIKYFATYHPKDILPAKTRRERMGYNLDYRIISHIPFPKKENNIIDLIIAIDTKKEKSGSSAMLGCLAAIEIGYSKIILCGCPLEGKNADGVNYKQFQRGWLYHEKKVQGIVKSMSGWTKEFLGAPDKGWLK